MVLLKSSKIAAGVGARDIFVFLSRIDFYPKIAQMLHWLQFRHTYGHSPTALGFDHMLRGVQNTLENFLKCSFQALLRRFPQNQIF